MSCLSVKTTLVETSTISVECVHVLECFFHLKVLFRIQKKSSLKEQTSYNSTQCSWGRKAGRSLDQHLAKVRRKIEMLRRNFIYSARFHKFVLKRLPPINKRKFVLPASRIFDEDVKGKVEELKKRRTELNQKEHFTRESTSHFGEDKLNFLNRAQKKKQQEQPPPPPKEDAFVDDDEDSPFKKFKMKAQQAQENMEQNTKGPRFGTDLEETLVHNMDFTVDPKEGVIISNPSQETNAAGRIFVCAVPGTLIPIAVRNLNC